MYLRAFTAVFSRWQYAVLAVTVALVVFAFATWLPNLGLLASILANQSLSIGARALFALNLLASIQTNFTVLSASYTVAIALLTGINVALIMYVMRRQRNLAVQGGATAGALGIISGILGMGCAACGSLILTSLLGTAGGAGAITVLPFHGGEFGIIGVVLLATATYLLVKQINKPMVCEVPITKP